jgi:hypothetical protein
MEWNDIFQALKENNWWPRSRHPTKLAFKIEGEVRVFYKKQKLKKFVTTKSALQKILKGILHTEKEDKYNQENTGKNKSH